MAAKNGFPFFDHLVYRVWYEKKGIMIRLPNKYFFQKLYMVKDECFS